jgi:hypothetical protein
MELRELVAESLQQEGANLVTNVLVLPPTPHEFCLIKWPRKGAVIQ